MNILHFYYLPPLLLKPFIWLIYVCGIWENCTTRNSCTIIYYYKRITTNNYEYLRFRVVCVCWPLHSGTLRLTCDRSTSRAVNLWPRAWAESIRPWFCGRGGGQRSPAKRMDQYPRFPPVLIHRPKRQSDNSIIEGGLYVILPGTGGKRVQWGDIR